VLNSGIGNISIIVRVDK